MGGTNHSREAQGSTQIMNPSPMICFALEGQRIDCKIEWHLDSRNADSKPTTRRLRVFSDDASFAEFYVVPILPSSLETSSLLGRRKDEGIMDSSLLSAWYTSCLNGHDNCQKHQESGSPGMTNPTRLIDVDSMRLVELETQTPPASRIPYAALSYVWGRHQQLRLTKATYEAFRSWIPEDRLPKTVRNAITIVRDLGIGYIWVDALCIKQDDAADWEIEAALMDRAYRQATLTICVAYGSDSGFGIPGPVASLISATPWDSRAWTFQERLLSTRCAIFTAEGMLWQCPTTTWREDIESALSKPVWTLDSVASPLQALQGNPLRSYTSCVSIYSGRKLTILNDKLAAFDGLGQVLGRRLHSRLVCGIPARYLDWALLWEPETASERIVKFPSWSWCGWNERVGWRLPTVEGTLFNLQNWLADHTWIVWYVGARGKWALVWDSKYPMSTVPSLQRWSGYTAGIYDPYGRSEDAAGCRYKANLKISTSATQDLLSSHGAISDFLLFQTFTGFFSLSRKSMSKSAFKSNLESGLHRFGITDSSGDWCGTIILDSTWFNSVGGVFEFAAISDAKEFSLEELDTWTYYIPEERQQAEE
ncbi:hypothetical protein ACJ41O_012889 [Fusarium nematophilum]